MLGLVRVCNVVIALSEDLPEPGALTGFLTPSVAGETTSTLDEKFVRHTCSRLFNLQQDQANKDF